MAAHGEAQPAQGNDEIDAFFALYPRFTYQRQEPIYRELFRMFGEFNWERDDPRRDEAWENFRIAVIQAFNSTFGSDAEDLATWQRICRCLEIAPIPNQLTGAREAVSRTHVNLVDLLQCVRTGNRVQTFRNLEELQSYTISTRRYFPKEEAYEGGLLRYLLREIENQYHGRRGKQRRKKGKSKKSNVA
ncbi:hypothetical protein BJX64DRAFT_288006 [Aspergillus heterothallicus]